MFNLSSSAAIDTDDVLTLAEAKAHLEIEETDWDALLPAYIGAAINMVERYGKIALTAREFTWTGDGFTSVIRLPIGPAGDVTAISYFDTSNAPQALDSADWNQSFERIEPAPGTSWPTCNGQIGGVSITFTAGYTNVKAQEPLLVAAVKLTVGDLFANRESSARKASYDMPNSARACVDLVRAPTL